MANQRGRTRTQRETWAFGLGMAVAFSMAIVPGLALGATHPIATLGGARAGALPGSAIVTPTWSNVTRHASAPYVPSARNAATFAYYPPQRSVVLVDGFAGTSTLAPIADTYMYNTTGHWVNATRSAGAPSARYAATMAYNPTSCAPALQSCLVLFGGETYVNSGTSTVRLLLNDTWIYNGSWHNVSGSVRGHIVGAPSPRFGATMAWDPALRGILLYGGNNGGNLSDTWLFKESASGGRWTQLTPLGSGVQARGPYNSLVFDGVDREMLMVARGNETWTFANDTWTQLVVNIAPPFSTGRILVSDPSLGVVLFGGYANCAPSSGCPPSAQTWVFQGGNWTSYRTVSHPVPTQFAAGAYDPVFHSVVLFGTAVLNSGGYTAADGTWLFR